MEDFENLTEELIHGTDRSAALLGGAMIDDALLLAINSRLLFEKHPDDFEALFVRENAPLGTLSSRIKMGKALAIYGQRLQRTLNTIRFIRNAFAHSIRPLLFTHELIADEIDLLPDGVLSETLGKDALNRLSPQRIRFTAVCTLTAMVLEDYARRHQDKEITIDMPDAGTFASIPLPRK